MQKYNLLSCVRRYRAYRHFGEHLHKYPNILNREFPATKPNEKWVTDISYIQTRQGVLYLSMIKDLYDNSIVAYKTGTEQTVNLVLETIKLAKRKEAVTAELQLHSDQGFQYTSHGYFNLTIIDKSFIDLYIDKIFVTPEDGKLKLEIKLCTDEITERYMESIKIRSGQTSLKR